MAVLIGVDPHKHSHTTAVLDQHGQLLAQQRFPGTRAGQRALQRWAAHWPQRCWAIEGAAGAGLALAQQLVGDGEQVLDVPAKLAARVRALSPGHGRKADTGDAIAIAHTALHAAGLRQVTVEQHPTVLRLLTDRRQHLVRTRTQTVNRLHRLLAELHPSGAERDLSADRAATLLRRVRPRGAVAATRRQLARDLVGEVRLLDRRITAVETRIRVAVTTANTSLLAVHGVGPVLAAWILGEVGDVRRFTTKAQFAAHNGTAPIEASSGQVVRHRLSRAGNRRLNHALYLIAVVQLRHPTAGQAYYRRKLAEGKTRKEALRCLKRRISDAVYRCLVADLVTDQQRPTPASNPSHQPG
jgi:transposase